MQSDTDTSQVSLFDDADEGNLAIRRGDRWFGLVPLEDQEDQAAIAPVLTEGPLSSPIAQFEGKERVSDNRKRGIMIRLAPEQWHRIHELALRENASVQALGLYAFSQVLEARGLPPL